LPWKGKEESAGADLHEVHGSKPNAEQESCFVKNCLLCVLSFMWASAAWAAAPLCFPVGTTMTLRGTPVQDVMETDGGSRQPVSLLAMDPPLCVIDKRYSQDAQGRVMVPRVLIIGPPLPTGVTLSVTGTLMRRSAPPYYMVPTAAWVVPPTMVPPRQ
jgi:hypothetical protein